MASTSQEPQSPYRQPLQAQLQQRCRRLRKKSQLLPKGDELLDCRIQLYSGDFDFTTFDKSMNEAASILAAACIANIRQEGSKSGLMTKISACLEGFTSLVDRWEEVERHLRDIVAWMVPEHTEYLSDSDASFRRIVYRNTKPLACLGKGYWVTPDLLINTWNDHSLPVVGVFTMRQFSGFQYDFEALQCIYALARAQQSRGPPLGAYHVTAILRKEHTKICNSCTRGKCGRHQHENSNTPMRVRVVEAVVSRRWLEAVQCVNAWKYPDMPWSFSDLPANCGVRISSSQWFNPLPHPRNLQRFLDSYGDPTIFKLGNTEPRMLARQVGLLGSIMHIFLPVIQVQRRHDKMFHDSIMWDSHWANKVTAAMIRENWRAWAMMNSVERTGRPEWVRYKKEQKELAKHVWLQAHASKRKRSNSPELDSSSSYSMSSHSSVESLKMMEEGRAEDLEKSETQPAAVYPIVAGLDCVTPPPTEPVHQFKNIRRHLPKRNKSGLPPSRLARGRTPEDIEVIDHELDVEMRVPGLLENDKERTPSPDSIPTVPDVVMEDPTSKTPSSSPILSAEGLDHLEFNETWAAEEGLVPELIGQPLCPSSTPGSASAVAQIPGGRATIDTKVNIRVKFWTVIEGTAREFGLWRWYTGGLRALKLDGDPWVEEEVEGAEERFRVERRMAEELDERGARARGEDSG